MAKILKFPWSNGQNRPFLTMTVAKIPELPWPNDQNWSILTIDHGKFQVFMVMVNFLTIDHGEIPGCHGHGQCLTPPPPNFIGGVGYEVSGTCLLRYGGFTLREKPKKKNQK